MKLILEKGTKYYQKKTRIKWRKRLKLFLEMKN